MIGPSHRETVDGLLRTCDARASSTKNKCFSHQGILTSTMGSATKQKALARRLWRFARDPACLYQHAALSGLLACSITCWFMYCRCFMMHDVQSAMASKHTHVTTMSIAQHHQSIQLSKFLMFTISWKHNVVWRPDSFARVCACVCLWRHLDHHHIRHLT